MDSIRDLNGEQKGKVMQKGLRLLCSMVAVLSVAVQTLSAMGGENPDIALAAKIAYYPSYNTLELRTGEILFRTEDGKAGLQAQYFDNPNLEGNPVLTRVDRNLNFNWEQGSPGQNIPEDGFSVRWTGRLAEAPRTDIYEWDVSHDDGMRLWIDGEKVVDAWGGPGRHTERTQVERGTRPHIKIEYRETGGDARARVSVRPLGAVTEQLFHTPDGEPGVRAEYFGNPDLEGEPVASRNVSRIHHHDYRVPGTGTDTWSIRWTGTLGPAPTSGTYMFEARHQDGARVFIDDVLVFEDWSTGKDTDLARFEMHEGEVVDFRIEMNQVPHGPVTMNVLPRIALADAYKKAEATLTLVDGDGETVQKKAFQLERFGDRRFVEIEPLKPGRYEVRLSAGLNTVNKTVVHRDFNWEDNKLGITDKIYPPFKPIEVSDGPVVNVVLRRYHLNELGLPAQIEARGQDKDSVYKELLAGPIQLIANGEAVTRGEGEFVKMDEREVVYEGRAAHPAVNITTRTTTEFDGCMKVELTLDPGGKAAEPTATDTKRQQSTVLESLVLEVPLKNEMAPLFHVVKGSPPIRQNTAGATPRGDGQIWDSTKLRCKKWPGNFKPYIWLGGPARGLSWFADNEKGWVMDWKNTPPCQTLHRKDATLTLRIHLVQRPVQLREARTITFGLMASPAKPMPEGWRRLARPDAKGIRFKMGQLFGLDAIFAAKYPRGKDFSPFEKFYAARLGEDIDLREFVNDWADKHLHDGMSDNLKRRYRSLMRNIMRTGRKLGPDTYFTAYFEEFRATTTWHEDHKVYWCEWNRLFQQQRERLFTDWKDWPVKKQHLRWFTGTGAIVPSYRDFACYFAAKWLENGVGIYFDNAFPETAYNTINTSAFVREDGSIQPSCGIWARRAYLRRIWNLHQELYRPETPQIMMLHMTNTHILPYMVWNQSNLDLEWKLPGVAPLQKKFSPELLRAESIGLQTGNIPLAMVKPGKKRKPAKGMSKEKFENIHETYRYGLYLHEIKYAPNISASSPPEPMIDFGYGLDDCEVINYWDDSASLKISDPDCKWLLLKRQGRLLICLVTWSDQKARVTATLDLDALGVDVSEVVNAETGEEVTTLEDGAFTIEMPPFGVHTLIVE
ncbi:MAG: glycoside hydrolase domain-containing protein [Candidatus Brocadiia bacterium]